MTSQDLNFFQQSDFSGGVNDSQETLKPNQVLDSRDCWTPLSVLERRPAYKTVGASYTFFQNTPTSLAYAVEDNGGVTSLLAGGPVTWAVTPALVSKLYMGFTNTPSSQSRLGISVKAPIATTVAPQNQSVVAMLEYWNGTSWSAINYIHNANVINNNLYNYSNGAAFSLNQTPNFAVAGVSNWLFMFGFPADIAQTTVAATTRYWFRWNFLNGFLVGAGANIGTTELIEVSTVPTKFVEYKKFLWNSGPRYINLAWEQISPAFSLLYTRQPMRGGPTHFGFDLGIDPRNAFPPTYATLPEFNTTYMAFGGTVSEFNSTTDAITNFYAPGASPFAAQVNTNPLIVGIDPVTGIKADYHPDRVPQLATFPTGNLTTYFKGLVWMTGFRDNINLIRWSAPAIDGAYNVWPEDSFETLSSAKDNSQITAIASLGDNLVVFKKDSIWQMIFMGLSDLELPMFRPELVVAGVGTEAPGSIQEVNGRLIFLAEDGFYAFNGTPAIQKLSDAINETIRDVNPARLPFATAINWRRQHVYLCAAAVNSFGSGTTNPNNIVFVFDYKHGSWWIWNMPVKTWIQENGVGLKEEIYFANDVGQFFQMERGGTDNGLAINPYVLTGRFGEDDILCKTTREVRLRSYNSDGNITFQLFGEDKILGEPLHTIVMNATTETLASPAPPNLCSNVEVRRRERKLSLSLTADWFQVKAAGFDTLQGIDVGFEQQSRR